MQTATRESLVPFWHSHALLLLLLLSAGGGDGRSMHGAVPDTRVQPFSS
jgi:hypothetical protein